MAGGIHDEMTGMVREVVDQLRTSGSDSARMTYTFRTLGALTGSVRARTQTPVLVSAVRHATRPDTFQVSGGRVDDETVEFLIAVADLPAGAVCAAGDTIEDPNDVAGASRKYHVVDAGREADQAAWRITCKGKRVG